jgi:hypothetical protein
MKRASVPEVFRLKPTGRLFVPHKLKLSGNMENKDNIEGSGDKRPHGSGDKMLALSGNKFGACSFKDQSDLRHRIR